MFQDSVRVRLIIGCTILCSIIAGQSYAHHPVAAKFDQSNHTTLTGMVSAISWANPHAHIFVRVDDGTGSPAEWAVELPSVIDLERSGWSEDTLDIGETITVEGPLALDGSEQIWGEAVARHRDDATLFTVDHDYMSELLAGRPEGLTPRWPDGQPRLGPPQGESGYWVYTGPGSLVEDGRDIPMDALGLLDDIDDASKVAPFQDWARDLYVYRQERSLRDDPSFLFCIPPGGPRQFQAPYGIQLVEERKRDRIFLLMGGGNRNWRLIYTDNREQVSQVAGNDDNPLFFGRSKARWDSDTLVIDSTGFNEAFWFSNGGLPHTRLLQLETRISRPDLNTLHYSVTITDPGAYTRPWTSSWDLEWVPGEETPRYYCQENRP